MLSQKFSFPEIERSHFVFTGFDCHAGRPRDAIFGTRRNRSMGRTCIPAFDFKNYRFPPADQTANMLTLLELPNTMIGEEILFANVDRKSDRMHSNGC